MPEWLRGLTRNQLLSEREGSNPFVRDFFFFIPRVPTGARPRQKLKKDTDLRSSGQPGGDEGGTHLGGTDQQMEVVVKVPQVDIVPGEGDGGFWQRQSDWYDDGSVSNSDDRPHHDRILSYRLPKSKKYDSAQPRIACSR